jgi:hypothetical protein
MPRFNPTVLQDENNKENFKKVLTFMYSLNSKVNIESNDIPVIKAKKFINDLQGNEHKKLAKMIEVMRLELLNIVSESELSSKNREQLERSLNANPMIFDNILSRNHIIAKIFANIATLLWNQQYQHRIMGCLESPPIINSGSMMFTFIPTNLLLNRLEIWGKHLESKGIYLGGSFLYNNNSISNDSGQLVASMKLLAQTIDDIKNDEQNAKGASCNWKMTPELELLIYVAMALFAYSMIVTPHYDILCSNNKANENYMSINAWLGFFDKIMAALMVVSAGSESIIGFTRLCKTKLCNTI